MNVRRTNGPAGATLRCLAFVAMFGLSVPAAALDSIFFDGFDDRSCAGSSPPPPQSNVCAAGHLVLIGYDYAPEVAIVAADPSAPKATAALTDLDHVLINAVAQSPAAQLPRRIRIAVVHENTESGELDYVLGTLAGALDVRTELIVVDDIAAALGGADVLLIPDQNGFLLGPGAQAIAAQIGPALRAFLEIGGVVVVLDGTFTAGDTELPSSTYQILDRQLLAIDAAQKFQGCAQVPCNLADPLLAAASSEICTGTHAVKFVSDEPWVTFALHDFDNATDEAFVLHRWFGSSDSGPVAMDIDFSDDSSADFSGGAVFFQQADGQQVAQCTTLSNGTAVHQMTVDNFVSLGLNALVHVPTLVTVLNAQPLDHLRFVLDHNVQAGTFDVVVDLPDTFPPGDYSYRVMLGCGASSSDSPTGIGVSMSTNCFNQDGSYNIIGEALVNGEVVAYTMRNGVTDAQGSLIAMPAWKSSNLFPAITGFAPGLDSIDLSIQLGADGIDYREGGGSVQRGGLPATFMFYSDPGFGFPLFGVLTHRERAWFDPNGQPVEVRSERTVRGARLLTLSVDAGSAFLPPITESVLSFDANDRIRIDWALAGNSLSGIDGGTARVSWFGESLHDWILVFPPGFSLTGPPNPGQLGDLFWPAPVDFDAVSVSLLQLDDATFLPSYLAYRQEILGLTRPPASAYTLRSTLRAPLPF